MIRSDVSTFRCFVAAESVSSHFALQMFRSSLFDDDSVRRKLKRIGITSLRQTFGDAWRESKGKRLLISQTRYAPVVEPADFAVRIKNILSSVNPVSRLRTFMHLWREGGGGN